MSHSDAGPVSSSPSVNKLRQFIRRSVQYQKFPSFPYLLGSENGVNNTDTSSAPETRESVDNFDTGILALQNGLQELQQNIHEMKEKNKSDLQNMVSIMKRDTTLLEQFGEQLDDFDQYVQVDKENIHIQMEEMEAKIHHQINDNCNDLQEAIERLYIRMDALEKRYQEQRQQKDIEDKESSYARNLVVQGINFCVTIAQVLLILVNTFVEAVRPMSSNAGNAAFMCIVAFIIAVLSDEEFGKAAYKCLKRVLPAW